MASTSKLTTTRGLERRPTLPSIHTLELPMLARSTLPNVQYTNHTNARNVNSNIRTTSMTHDRRVSTSSSTTTVSRSSSPASPQAAFPSLLPPKFRLIPCEMENAQAIIFFPPPNAPDANACNYTASSGDGKGILLVGSALQKITRNPQRPIAKGARVHPYRIAVGENPNNSRRASVISITAYPTAPPRLS